jgi:hypothetical protein
MSSDESSTFGQKAAAFWYFCAAPSQRGVSTLNQREKVRRGRIASWILLLVLGLDVLPIPGVLGKPAILGILFVVLFIDIVAVVLNRAGSLAWAGILTILTIEAGVFGTLFGIQGGATSLDLPLFDVLLQAVVVATVMLAPIWGLVIMGLNIILIWGFMHYGPLSPELAHLFQLRGFTILEQAYVFQISITIFLVIVVISDLNAVQRADRAETIADLEKAMVLKQEEELDAKKKLEQEMGMILAAFNRFNNGDLDAQIPIGKDNRLFQISFALNNMFARLKRAKMTEEQLKNENTRLQGMWLSRPSAPTQSSSLVTEQAVRQLADSLKRGELPQQPSGTSVDEVVAILNANRSSRHF